MTWAQLRFILIGTLTVSSQSFCPALEMASLCQIMHYRQTVIKIQRGRYGCIRNKEKVAS